jgi:outer membrane protein, multidrug efflux system
VAEVGEVDRTRRSRFALLVAAAIGLQMATSGCALGPNYRRPAVAIPETLRGQTGPANPESLADLSWWTVFRDSTLQTLIVEAIRQNHDLRAAAARVEQARQLVTVARADLFPQLSYQGEAARQRAFAPGVPTTTEFNAFLGTFNLAWEIDIWGRIRRETEAARAQYWAAEAVRRGVLLTLVSDVAQAYFDLLELDRELEITRRTVDTFSNTADLFYRRYQGGIGTLLEVSRARAALTDAEASLFDIERQRALKENQISVLLGRPPGEIVLGLPIDVQPTLPSVPIGLPSQLLERRPDLREAEDAVVTANAEVGAAIANFFPRLGLTSLYGGQSSELENLVKRSGNVWALSGSLAGPLFQGGRLLANYEATRAQWEEAAEHYQQTVLQSFREVSDTLVTRTKLRRVRGEREDTVSALETSVTLSLQRYNDGIANYFEVLEAQQQLFPAEIGLARTQRDELAAVVTLYRALGGGWQLDVRDWGGAEDRGIAATDAISPPDH